MSYMWMLQISLLCGACTSSPGVVLLCAGFQCLRVPGSAVCMGGGIDTGVALICVGMGLMGGGSICCVTSYAMRRRRSLSAQVSSVPECVEMICGTIFLAIGAMMLGFGRLCLRDVHLGACHHTTAIAIVCGGASLMWSGVLLILTFGYLVNEGGGAPHSWPAASRDLEAGASEDDNCAWASVAASFEEVEARALVPPASISMHHTHRRGGSGAPNH